MHFSNEVLMLSSGMDDFGTISWQLLICLLVAWIAVFLCSFRGIKTSGRVGSSRSCVQYNGFRLFIAR